MSSFKYDFIKFNKDPPIHSGHVSEPINLRRDGFSAPVIISGVVGIATAAAVVYFLIKCLKKAIPSYAREATHVVHSSPSWVISVAPIAISPVHNWEVPDQFGTLERFLKPTRFSSEQLAVIPEITPPCSVPVLTDLYTKVNRLKLNCSMVEVSAIRRTHHINLIKLYGFCFDPTTMAFVYVYMENGSLDRFLFGDKSTINWCKMNEIAVGGVDGSRIIHYDIKPGNILLDGNLTPKVVDFGLAKFHNRGSNRILLMGFYGTLGYVAPKIWKSYPITYKWDVYSFGMLLFEIVGRRRNHNPNQSESRQWLPRLTWDMLQNGELLVMVSLCGVLEGAQEKALRMLKVALLCIQYKPEARPAMSTVVKMLDGDMEIPTPKYPFEYLDPAKPYQLSENGRKWDSESSAFEDRVF
ncbi:hypothetical protein ACJRO7_014974 [Eucalyptus globulus]|uniref:Protein kinase domain-containing protein n=1 Tax=Eucalyptus globulus TaxID=34317 RepID=A0ABD3L5W2_EUCGL